MLSPRFETDSDPFPFPPVRRILRANKPPLNQLNHKNPEKIDKNPLDFSRCPLRTKLLPALGFLATAHRSDPSSDQRRTYTRSSFLPGLTCTSTERDSHRMEERLCPIVDAQVGVGKRRHDRPAKEWPLLLLLLQGLQFDLSQPDPCVSVCAYA